MGGSLSIVWMEKGKNLENLLVNKYSKVNLRTEPKLSSKGILKSDM
jgi:hypothetical protein